MNRRTLLTLFAAIPFFLLGCASAGKMDDSKIDQLASGVGITTEQAQAGVGAILKLAQFRLTQAEYQKIAAVVPDGNEFMALAERLNAFQGATPTAEGLSGALDTLGLTPAQASKLETTVTDYVSEAAGRDVGLRLKNALK